MSVYEYVGSSAIIFTDPLGAARTKTYQEDTKERSVESVQYIVGANPDGKYGRVTRDCVREYQTYLKSVGLYHGKIDGKWGDATETAHRNHPTPTGKTIGELEDAERNKPIGAQPGNPQQPTPGPATTQPPKPKVMNDPSLASYSRRDREAFAGKMKQQYEQWVSANPDKLHGACLDSLTVTAQWMHETAWGDKAIGHNWGNIKGTGPAGTTEAGTWEHIKGRRVNIRAGFRKYNNNSEFYEDYHKLIGTKERYKAARGSAGIPLKGRPFYEALKSAGYATDEDYVEKVMALYRQLGGK